jgi:hypothetical protein
VVAVAGCDIAIDRRSTGMAQGDNMAVNKPRDKEETGDI